MAIEQGIKVRKVRKFSIAVMVLALWTEMAAQWKDCGSPALLMVLSMLYLLIGGCLFIFVESE